MGEIQTRLWRGSARTRRETRSGDEALKEAKALVTMPRPHSTKFDQVAQLLAEGRLSQAEIGRAVDLSRERVRQIQVRYFPDLKPPVTYGKFPRLVQRWLSEINAQWCPKCHIVKDACEGFSSSERFRHGRICNACTAEYRRIRWQTDLEWREGCKAYHREWLARRKRASDQPSDQSIAHGAQSSSD